jgi:toxin-antitoxin system PIN domain toxin
MDLCDSNVWLALALSKHVHHSSARDWLEGVARPGAVLFCRSTQLSFLRLLTNATVLAPYGNPPLTNEEAWSAYEALAADDRIAMRAGEPPGLEAHWRVFASRASASPKLWMDAYLAAFARAGGLRIVTTDAAFRQFSQLDLLLLGQTAGPRHREP